MKKARFSIAVALAIALLAIPVGIALASTANWYGTVGGVSVHAQKNVYLSRSNWYSGFTNPLTAYSAQYYRNGLWSYWST